MGTKEQKQYRLHVREMVKAGKVNRPDNGVWENDNKCPYPLSQHQIDCSKYGMLGKKSGKKKKAKGQQKLE